MKRYILLFFLCWSVVFVAVADSIKNVARPRVGLVLSGGGAKGIAHVGALKVIEELGIPIDYIGGTSMGSIVGGLYSLGYTSIQLEQFVKEADWDVILTDRVLRRLVSIYEKDDRKRYWMRFAIRRGKIDLPLGILTGQNVSNLFTELASPAYAQSDFSKFPTPFLCVATDIETGTEVVLESGNLVKAMRASMAIPSVFTPETIDGKRLFDGGLTNNFPANLVLDKGVDILIGVDVSSQPEDSKFDNVYQVMEQVVFMASLPLKENNKNLCKVLIIPSISEYSASSFNAADSLILRGERAARGRYKELKALADSLRSFEPDKPRVQEICPQPLYSFYVSDVKINGLKQTSRDFFLQKLELNFPDEITFSQLENAVDKVRGTQAFYSIVYQINPLPDDAVELQFDCIESDENTLRVGLHYDKEYQASLLLSLSLKNALLKNSKALAELAIGENPAFSLSYFHSPGLKPVGKTLFNSSLSPDWMFHVNGYRFDAYNYSGNQRMSAFTFSNLSLGIQLLISPSLSSVVGGAVFGDYSVRTEISSEIQDVKSNYLYMNYQFFYERDSYNEDYFPTRGRKFRLEGTYYKGLSKNVRYSEGLIGITFRSNFAVSPTKHWTIHTGIDAGSIFGTDIPSQYMMCLGGAPDRHLRNDMTFVGMHFLQESDKNAWVTHFNNQLRLWNNIYATLRFNFGKTTRDFSDLIALEDLRLGYGASIQYNSVVGPIGFTLSSSNVTRSLLSALNVGFWF